MLHSCLYFQFLTMCPIHSNWGGWKEILNLNFTYRAKSAAIKLNAFTLQRLAYKLFGYDEFI